jgi:hypothetical protein
MSVAKKLAGMTSEMRREESPHPELLPYVSRNMLHHPLVVGLILDRDHAGEVNARYREVSRKTKDAFGKQGRKGGRPRQRRVRGCQRWRQDREGDASRAARGRK